MSDADELVERIATVLAAAGVVVDMRLCCALSGGVDSVVLFEVLCRLQPRFGYRLSAAHVHHGLSPHAGVWAEACVARCARAGVPLQVFHVEVDRLHRDGVEAAARAAFAISLDYTLLNHVADHALGSAARQCWVLCQQFIQAQAIWAVCNAVQKVILSWHGLMVYLAQFLV